MQYTVPNGFLQCLNVFHMIKSIYQKAQLFTTRAGCYRIFLGKQFRSIKPKKLDSTNQVSLMVINCQVGFSI